MHRHSFTLAFFFSFSLSLNAAEGFEGFLRQGQTHLQQGQYYLALDDGQSAQGSAANSVQQAQALGLLGLAHYQMRHFEKADALLHQAMDLGAGEAQERARWMVALANIQTERGQPEEAGRLYAQASQAVGDNPALALGIRLGQVQLLPPEKRLNELQEIRSALRNIGSAADRARYSVNLGTQARVLGAAGLKLAYESLEQARQDAVGQPRILAEALGGLAQLYEDQQRQDEASHLNRQAIQAAQSADARDLLLDLEWRQGRLHRALKQIPEALAAYERAVEHIEAIRQDIPVEYHDGHSSFRETLEPVYLGLADLLLQQASQQNGVPKVALLRHAREAVELIKRSEIEDFLGGRCAVQATKSALLESVESNTAVIYPVILPDRLELLVSSGNELQQFTQPVSAATLQGLARKMAHSLRMGHSDSQAIARQLHGWLIGPLEPWLRQHQVKTLVMVPDGALRLIPLSALHDGGHYLVERYALATSPGLTLMDPEPLQQRGGKALLAGMSEPGAVVDHLPSLLLGALAGGATGRGVDADEPPRSRALPAIQADTGETRQIDAERLRKEPALRQKLKEQLSLPGVGREMDSLRREMPNTLLMNEGFTVESFKQHIGAEPYSVVHIASHGVFGKTAATSFIMAYDDVINIDDLEGLLKSDKFKKQPVEMLTLSACQTAEGDDRAPLGLTGVALKAKVRSALGTLWPVSDEAAAKLMAVFYKALSQPGASKVQALQQAQIAILREKGMEHPFYWAPFILVGNWL